MQPTYLSWSGYFNLIWNADTFIFLDDVQYSKNSFFNRNRYPARNEEGFGWLTLPIRKDKLAQHLKDSRFADDTAWRKKHLGTLQGVYGKHPYFKEFYPILERNLSDTGLDTLAGLSIAVTRSICGYLGIERDFRIASRLDVAGNRSERLLAFCRQAGCQVYLSPAGAREYLSEDGVLPSPDVEVWFQDFACAPYPQKGMDGFVPYMSMIDPIFNLGPAGALDLVNGRIVPEARPVAEGA